MTDFLADHLTDLLRRQPQPAMSKPSSSAPFQDQLSSPNPINRASNQKAITYSFSTDFGASSHQSQGSGSGSPASPSSQRSCYFSNPQRPTPSKPSEEHGMIFDLLGCGTERGNHHRGESEGSATSFSSATTTSPKTYCSSPPLLGPSPSSVGKPPVNNDQIGFNEIAIPDQIGQKDPSSASTRSIFSQQAKDEVKGPITVRPTFTSMISAPYNPSRQQVVPSVRPLINRTETASSSSQKRLRLVPVGEDGRRFQFVEDEDALENTAGGHSPLARDGFSRFTEISTSGSEVAGGSETSPSVGASLQNSIGVDQLSPVGSKVDQIPLGPTFPEAVAVPIRLGDLSPEERKAFLLTNSNRGHQVETQDATSSSIGMINTVSNRAVTATGQAQDEDAEATQVEHSGGKDLARGRTRQRDAPPTSHEELSSQLIGHIKQSPEAQQWDWNHPQMSMPGSDIRDWISGIVADNESMQEQEDVLEMSQVQLDELQDTLDSMDLNDEGEPAWLEHRRASEHAAQLSAVSRGEIDHEDYIDSSSGSGSEEPLQRRPSPNNLSTVDSHLTAATTANSALSDPKQDNIEKALGSKWKGETKAREQDQELKRAASSSSSDQQPSSNSNSLSSSYSIDAPNLPTTLKMSVGDSSTPRRNQQHQQSVVHASEFQSRPRTKIDGRASSYNTSDESSEDNRGLGRIREGPPLPDLHTKAEMLNQVTYDL